MPPLAAVSTAKQQGNESAGFFSFLEPQQVENTPNGTSSSKYRSSDTDGTHDFLASLDESRPSESKPAGRPTTARKANQRNKKNLLISGGVAAFFLLLVIAFFSRGGGFSSKHDFYEPAMKLAEASHRLESAGSGDSRTLSMASYRLDLKRCEARIRELNEEIDKLQQSIQTFRSTGVVADGNTHGVYFSTDILDDAKKSIEYWRKQGNEDEVKRRQADVANLEKVVQGQRDDYLARCQGYVDETNKELDDQKKTLAKATKSLSDLESEIRAKPYVAGDALTEHMSIADLKKRLGDPDSILKHNRWHQTWIYQFNDGLVHISVHSSGIGGSDDMSRDDTRVRLNPQEVEML